MYLGLSLSLSLSLSFSFSFSFSFLSDLSLLRWYHCSRVASLIGFIIVCRFLSSAQLSFSLLRRGRNQLCPLPTSIVCVFSFAVLCGVSLVYLFFRFLSFLSPVSCHSSLCRRFLYLSSLDYPPVVSVVSISLSLVLFLVVCKSSVFDLALLLSLVVFLCAPGIFFPFRVRSLFLICYTLPLLCITPLCCPFIRLSPGFFSLLFILFSFLFSPLLSFAAVTLSRRFRFRSSVHIPSFFLLAVLSFFSGGSPYVAFALFLPSLGLCLRFSRRFLSFHRLSAGMCVVIKLFFFFSLFASFLFLRGLACCICVSRGFFFCSLLASSVLSPTSSGGVPWLVLALLPFPLLRCCVSSLPMFHNP